MILMKNLWRVSLAAWMTSAWLLTGCTRQPPADESRINESAGLSKATGKLRGVVMGLPTPKPDFTLTALDGTSFDLRRDTEGFLTLLFFGYTHCPDVCPVHMANIGKVLKGLPSGVTSKIKVVFVTTDPERDTVERLREWLGGFHRDFIGLTGTLEEIVQAQRAAGVLPAVRDSVDASDPSTYYVSHAAQVTAYTADNLAHVIYPFGIRQPDWANDLPILVNGWPE
jgi:protein SCO1/2